MYFQQRYLEESKTFTALSGVDTIELPNKGLLSGIELRLWGTCGVGATKPDVWLHDRITKLELIVNGSKVVKSLTGEQLLADMLYKKTPHYAHDMKNMDAASCEEFFYLNLGRHYHDFDYMLDLGRVNDPELRIEYDFTKTSQNGWTNGVAMSAAPSRSVICHLLREPTGILPKGYIKTSELSRFTGAASKKENMSIPRGPVYSNLYVQSWYKAQGLGYLLDKLELNFNNDALIPIRVGATELAAEIVRMYNLFKMSQQFKATGGQPYPAPIEQGVFLGHLIQGVNAIIAGGDLWGDAWATQYTILTTGVAGAAQINAYLDYEGVWPFSVSPIPYFDPWDARTWVDSGKLGDFWVRFEGNASMGTSVVVKLLGDEVVTKYESL